MITLCRAHERRHDRRRKQEVWLTFGPTGPLPDGFGTLETLGESRFPPGSGGPRHTYHDTEIITYVRDGALAYEDSLGHSGVLHAGEFQRMTAGKGIRRSQTNASRSDAAHVFQLGLRPSQGGLERGYEHKRFSTAERRGLLCLIASPDRRRGSMSIYQDAMMYSAILDPGQHQVHELQDGRIAWVHVVEGEVTLGDVILTTGDGAGLTSERAVSLTAREETEILLLDLVDPKQPTVCAPPEGSPSY